jgi:Cu2+-exporting ATPase
MTYISVLKIFCNVVKVRGNFPDRVSPILVESQCCFHCLQPTPKFSRIFAEVDGQRQAMCCYGCKAAAEYIDGQLLSNFYVYRGQSGQKQFFGDVAVKGFDAEAKNEWTYLDNERNAADYVWFDQRGRRCIDLSVSGLYCSSCSWLIEKALKQTFPSIDVRVQLDAKRVRVVVENSDANVALSRVLKVISNLGYIPTPLTIKNKYQGLEYLRVLENQQSIKRILVAGLGMMQVMTYAVGLYLGELQGIDDEQYRFLTLVSMLVATVVVLYSGKPFFINALNDLSNRHFGMDVPIAFAIAGAYFLSVYDVLVGTGQNIYFDSAVMFVFFLLIGRYLEMRARHHLNDAHDGLMRLLPLRINIQRICGSELITHNISPYDIHVADQLVLSAGNVVPFDANIINGEASMDESLLTGEVRAVNKSAGGSLLAGSRLVSGVLSIEANCVWSESSIVKIETLLSQGSTAPNNRQLSLQRFSQVFVLTVLLLTVAVACSWWVYDSSRVFEITLAMLIASCPCAFALAIPVGLTAASSALRKHGVLVANLDSLQKLSEITTWHFDKTGTLTKGEMSLEHVQAMSNLSEVDCVDIAAALESHSRHSLASAFINFETSLKASDVIETAGNGLKGVIGGQQYMLGKRTWVLGQLELNLEENKILQDSYSHCSEMILATSKGVLAIIYVSDKLRDGAQEAISFIKSNGKKISILSGDKTSAVRAVAASLAIDDAFSEMLPEQKAQHIASAQAATQIVAMVGDGLNDAPVLGQADVSIALASGSELTQSQADVVLINGGLDKLIILHQIAQLSKKITRLNLGWALAYNAVVLPLAAFGYLTPWMAALGMSSSSLMVVVNALRIRTKKQS